MCDLNPKVREQLDAYGLTEMIGADRIFETSHDAAARVHGGDRHAVQAPASPSTMPTRDRRLNGP